MGKLEKVDGQNWREFVEAPLAVLVIGKSDCPACAAWSEELESFLAQDTAWPHVRFGKMLLDTGGLIDFKRANLWLADLDVLPFNQIYVGGKRAKGFPGGGIDRLESRLKSLSA
jgi:hypothetical protein